MCQRGAQVKSGKEISEVYLLSKSPRAMNYKVTPYWLEDFKQRFS